MYRSRLLGRERWCTVPSEACQCGPWSCDEAESSRVCSNCTYKFVFDFESHSITHHTHCTIRVLFRSACLRPPAARRPANCPASSKNSSWQRTHARVRDARWPHGGNGVSYIRYTGLMLIKNKVINLMRLTPAQIEVVCLFLGSWYSQRYM